MFYRIVKLSASLEESTVFQSENWAVTGFEFANLIKYLTKEDHLGIGMFEDFVENGFVFNAERYYVEMFRNPKDSHYVEAFVDNASHGRIPWGEWYELAYYSRNHRVQAFIGSVNVTPNPDDPQWELWG